MPSKWLKTVQKKQYDDHRRRIEKMEPKVDTKPPRELPFSGKKEIERRRFHATIERGNKELLTRLGKAMQIKNIDNESTVAKGISLQACQKRLELERITADNRRLLERIQKTLPAYNHLQWEREAEAREKILMNMTEFPEMYVPKYQISKKLTKIREQAVIMSTKNSPSNSPTSSPKATERKSFGEIEPPAEQPAGGLHRPVLPKAYSPSAHG